MILAHWHRLKETQRTEPAGIAFKTSTTGAFQNFFLGNNSVTLSGLSSGDFVVAFLVENDVAQIPLSSGWTNINSSTTNQSIRAAYIFATGSSVTYSFPQTSGVDGIMTLAAFTNVNSTTPLDTTATTNSSASASQITPSSITTSTDGCMILAGFGAGGSELTITDPTNTTNIEQAFGGGLVDSIPANSSLVRRSQTSAGQETFGAFDFNAASRQCRTLTIALRPA